MSENTYQCKSCGARLVFSSETKRWKCTFCKTVCPEEDLLVENAEEQTQLDESSLVVYRCSTCGSKIMTTEATAVPHCYYCHGALEQLGKATKDMLPQKLLPFSISKEQAIERFLKWAKENKFKPRKLLAKSQLQNLSGTFFPHYMTTCTADCVFDGEGASNQEKNEYFGDYILVKRKVYKLHRKARLRFRDLLVPAMHKPQRKLAEDIHPFSVTTAKNFAESCLDGFVAEVPDISEAAVQRDAQEQIATYAKKAIMRGSEYEECTGSIAAQYVEVQNNYVLLPVWVLTYPDPKNPRKPCYFAMNGKTGNIYGDTPSTGKKTKLYAVLFAAALFVAFVLYFYFLF